MTKSKPILFFGSGPVASASLEFIASNFDIACVITKRKPAHHKDPAPVEELATKKGIKLLYANNADELQKIIEPFNDYLGIVVDFGVIIPSAVTNKNKLINSHFSLLPEWRGPDPITYALLSGQNKTGVSLMYVAVGIDTGNVITQSVVNISSTDTNLLLTKKLIDSSNNLLKKYIPLLIQGEVNATPQPPSIATYSNFIYKQQANLSFDKPAAVVCREVKAYNPWPGLRLNLGGITVIITDAKISDSKLTPGQLRINDTSILVGCQLGSLEILTLKPLGKKEMPVKAFLNGYKGKIKEATG